MTLPIDRRPSGTRAAWGGGLVLVSGLCRCGSSLMMQMLSAGGWPVVEPEKAPWPGFEHPANAGDATLPADASGVLKWLDPQHFPPLFDRVRGSIFLTRNHGQQARSHLKFLRAVGFPAAGAKWRPIADSFRGDERAAKAILGKLGPVREVTFETLVSAPMTIMAEVSAWLDDRLDIKAAAAQLRPRVSGAAVLPYMLEERLLEEEARSGFAAPAGSPRGGR